MMNTRNPVHQDDSGGHFILCGPDPVEVTYEPLDAQQLDDLGEFSDDFQQWYLEHLAEEGPPPKPSDTDIFRAQHAEQQQAAWDRATEYEMNYFGRSGGEAIGH